MREIALAAMGFGDDDAAFYRYARDHDLTVNEVAYCLNAYEAGGEAGLRAIAIPVIIPPDIARETIKTIVATLEEHFQGRVPYRLTDEGSCFCYFGVTTGVSGKVEVGSGGVGTDVGDWVGASKGSGVLFNGGLMGAWVVGSSVARLRMKIPTMANPRDARAKMVNRRRDCAISRR